jgi:hypothetical protein
LVSIASLYFPPQGAGNYTQIIIKIQNWLLFNDRGRIEPG